jgi:hypothetical protein
MMAAAGVAFLALLTGGCVWNAVPTGETTSESRSVDLPKAEMVHADLRMGAGELRLEGGAAKLMEAQFRYNVADWKPDIRYDQTGFRGQLVIEQGGKGGATGNVVNDWNIRLNDTVPLDLEVKLGAGEAHLDLGGLTMRSANVKMGAGTSEIKFSSEPKHSFDLNLRGGVGEATVRIPKSIGVIAKAKGGLGEINVHGFSKDGDTYVNDAYGKSKVVMNVDVQGGIGQINLYSE